MMFETLVCGFSDDQEDDDVQDAFEIFKGSKSVCDEILRKTSYFDHVKTEEGSEEKRDPILQYLQKYYMGSAAEEVEHQAESLTDVGDLSWDEGDLPSRLIQVWTFNDFMEQYNQLYAWLNTIQVQYHSAKKAEGSSPRVEALLKDLERDVEKREHFLRECGRMVGAFPELEEEVTWRVEHVIAKWDMLSKLRIKPRVEAETDIPDIYADIELEVRCLRRWLKEMEQRIDPLQFSKIAEWSTTDRERKMAEYQVLQTDIESHGRIVKLVLGLCEDLTSNPGLYDLQHAVKVAKGLEKRWHHIWLRSLEWQCLLEEWIQDPVQGIINGGDVLLDTDDEPLSKVPKMNAAFGTPHLSPAASLLRRKKRKRWINSENSDDLIAMAPDKREKLISPRQRRYQDPDSDRSSGGEEGLDQQQDVTNMITSESDPSLVEQVSTHLDKCVNSSNASYAMKREQSSFCSREKYDEKSMVYNDMDMPMTSTPISGKTIRNLASKAESMVLANDTKKTKFRYEACDEPHNQFFESERYDRNNGNFSFSCLPETENGNNRYASGDWNRCEDITIGYQKKISSESMFSQDSLEPRIFFNQQSNEEFYSGYNSLDEVTSEDISAISSQSSDLMISKETTDGDVENGAKKDGTVNKISDFLNFGDDYRKFIDSLSDSSANSNYAVSKNKKFRRKSRRREICDEFPNESQSDLELEEACLLLSDSQKEINGVESSANGHFSQGFVQKYNTQDYDEILKKCSLNVNILFNLLENVSERDSFVSQKKCREIRLLISRWENLLQKVSDNVNNSKIFEELKQQTRALREQMIQINNSSTKSLQFSFEENQDLETKMQGIKDEIGILSNMKAAMFDLNIAVHNFLSDLGMSPSVDDKHIILVEGLKEEVVNLYSLWDNCYQQAKQNLSKTEEAIKKLRDFEREILELRSALQKDTFTLKQRHGKKKMQQHVLLKMQRSSGDSGISDGSCGFSSDYDFPYKHERLTKLRIMAKSLEDTLGPTAPPVLIISKTLDATSSELDDLETTYLSFKAFKKKKIKSKPNFGVKTDKEKFRPKPSSVSSGQRRKKFAKITLTIQALLLLALFLSWLCQPKCCDSLSAISTFSPQLKYVNGPPPI